MDYSFSKPFIRERENIMNEDWLANAYKGSYPIVLVLPEIFGMQAHIKDVRGIGSA